MDKVADLMAGIKAGDLTVELALEAALSATPDAEDRTAMLARTRTPAPYKENSEDAKKPHEVRHALMSGHEAKDRTLAALDTYVGAYSPAIRDVEGFVANVGQWMLNWYNTLACNAVDLKHTYRALLADVDSNIKEVQDYNETMRVEEYEKLQAKRQNLHAGVERNEEDYKYWNERYETLREAVQTFISDFRSTNYGHRR